MEAAVIIAALCILIFGIAGFGTALWQLNEITQAVQQVGRYAMINNATITAASAETQMQILLPSAAVCTVSGSTVNPPATAGDRCVYVSTATGTSPDPNTISITAIYAYVVFGIPGTLSVASTGTFPLD